MKKTLIATMFFACLFCAPRSRAQLEENNKAEVAISYNFLRTNAPPGGCGCFSMNGGSLGIGYAFDRHWTGVLDFAWTYNGNVNASGGDLLLTNALAGVRYRLSTHSRWKPFIEIEAGNSNAGGALSPAHLGLGHANVFAAAAGGGVDLALTNHIYWRAAQADYLPTLFNNGKNDHQNNLRVETGIVFRFGK